MKSTTSVPQMNLQRFSAHPLETEKAAATYWVQIGQHYNIGPMLVRYCGANVTVSQY